MLVPGQRHDNVEPLIKGVNFGALLAYKAFDSNALRTTLNESGTLVVVTRELRFTLHIEWRYAEGWWRFSQAQVSVTLRNEAQAKMYSSSIRSALG